MQAALVGLSGVLGLLFGSFANVPIHRWPIGGTAGKPKRSACPGCNVEIRALDNIPILSWLVLRGRCRHCDASISARYLAVEALMAALFVATVWFWGFDPLVPALLVLVWSLVVASVIDLEHRIIPNRLTLRLPLVLLPLLIGAAAVDGAWIDLRRALIAGVAVPGAMLALSEAFRLVRGQQGIGMGDIKLAVSIGLVVGYLSGWHLVVFAYATMIAAMLIVLGLVGTGRAGLATRIPFGPYLAIGALVAVLAGEPSTGLVRRMLGV